MNNGNTEAYYFDYSITKEEKQQALYFTDDFNCLWNNTSASAIQLFAPVGI